MGDEIQIISHNYPAVYPSEAYVLWKFWDGSGSENSETVYHISFGTIHLASGDFLRVGYGWDPDNSSAIIDSFGDDYTGHPRDLLLPARDMFFEFDADAFSERSGFRISIRVSNISGKKISSILMF